MDKMKFDEQLKFYRTKNNLSQEGLAEKLYVSRQTISNWENKKSFPDIHNLLLLSVLFDVSLDTLVKGEIEKMKNSRDIRSYKQITVICDISCLLGIFLMIFGRHYFGEYFSYIIGAVILVVFVLSRFLLRKIETRNNVSNSIHDPKEAHEVLLFLENPNLTREKFEEFRRRESRNNQIKWIIQTIIIVAFIFFSAYISNLLI